MADLNIKGLIAASDLKIYKRKKGNPLDPYHIVVIGHFDLSSYISQLKVALETIAPLQFEIKHYTSPQVMEFKLSADNNIAIIQFYDPEVDASTQMVTGYNIGFYLTCLNELIDNTIEQVKQAYTELANHHFNPDPVDIGNLVIQDLPDINQDLSNTIEVVHEMLVYLPKPSPDDVKFLAKIAAKQAPNGQIIRTESLNYFTNHLLEFKSPIKAILNFSNEEIPADLIEAEYGYYAQIPSIGLLRNSVSLQKLISQSYPAPDSFPRTYISIPEIQAALSDQISDYHTNDEEDISSNQTSLTEQIINNYAGANMSYPLLVLGRPPAADNLAFQGLLQAVNNQSPQFFANSKDVITPGIVLIIGFDYMQKAYEVQQIAKQRFADHEINSHLMIFAVNDWESFENDAWMRQLFLYNLMQVENYVYGNLFLQIR